MELKTPKGTAFKLQTPRGTFKLQSIFANDMEAKKAGYGMYFTHYEGDLKCDVYTKPIDGKEHSKHFAITEWKIV